MFKKFLQIFVITLFFNSMACAEQPASAVPKGLNPERPDVVAVDSGFEVERMALVYQGFNLDSGQPCTLYLAGYEPENEGDFYSVLTKIETRIHTVTPVDMLAHFYRYSLQEGRFYETQESLENTTPALASILLSDETIVPDINKKVFYEGQMHKGDKLLVQSMRVDFFDFDVVAFQMGLETVMQDNSTLSSQSALLNQMNRAILKVRHSGHHDPGTCTDFQLLGEMQPQIFKINQALPDSHEDGADDHSEEGHEHSDNHDHEDHGDEHLDSDGHMDHDDEHDHGDHDHSHDHN